MIIYSFLNMIYKNINFIELFHKIVLFKYNTLDIEILDIEGI